MAGRIKLLDCTLRDGGYYNNWDFTHELIADYLHAMSALQVDFVEIGFRAKKKEGFYGGCAFSTDSYINSLAIPSSLSDKIGVMVNGAELVSDVKGDEISVHQELVLNEMFADKAHSPVTLVRIACHVHEFIDCLPAARWLKDKGYLVGFNVMQIATCSDDEITHLARQASQFPIDTLYFADSMGSLDPEMTSDVLAAIQKGWDGAVGIHTHDNMGNGLANTLRAIKDGVTWVDCTVTGMGRGPGNVQTEYLALALEEHKPKANFTKLFELIRNHFKPMQSKFGWGTNPYYYLAGKHGIHPSYIQEMLSDSRYTDEDIIAVIDHLKVEGGKKFSLDTLDVARHFYSGEPRGSWSPADMIAGNDVLILGTGPGVARHRKAIESYIKRNHPFVIALNTQSAIDQELIKLRAACHPVRLLADCHEHLKLPQPLITPASMLPDDVKNELKSKELLDFGISVQLDKFAFYGNYCILPHSLVLAYALAVANSGNAKHIFLAGFDGYPSDDPRRKEIDHVFKLYQDTGNTVSLSSITPTRYEIPVQSIYGFEE